MLLMTWWYWHDSECQNDLRFEVEQARNTKARQTADDRPSIQTRPQLRQPGNKDEEEDNAAWYLSYHSYINYLNYLKYLNYLN